MNVIFGILIVLLLAAGIFNFIAWKFNIIAIVVLVVVWFATMYNSFIRLRTRAQEAWADIDVQLKRRYDLIPNLVNTVKGYATHESTAFEKVSEARSRAMQATTPGAKGEAENMLSGTLKSLFAISEAYPELKANTNFLQLQSELSDTENKIQAARRFYNGNVRDLNTGVAMFPGNIIAGIFGFKKMDFFQLQEGEAAREAVEVKF
jgi:LemA protein